WRSTRWTQASSTPPWHAPRATRNNAAGTWCAHGSTAPTGSASARRGTAAPAAALPGGPMPCSPARATPATPPSGSSPPRRATPRPGPVPRPPPGPPEPYSGPTMSTAAPAQPAAAAPPAATGPSAPRGTYQVRTFGCQMNVHGSERLTGMLETAGYTAAPADADPRRGEVDVVVFNTCAVRENADNKLYGTLGALRPAKAANPGLQIG